MQSLPHLKDPLERLVCVTVRNFNLTQMSLRLSVRRKATRGTNVNTLVQRGEEDRILKCFCMIEDTGRVVCDNKRNATGLVGCGLTGFEFFFACDSKNALDLVFEE